MKWIVFIPLLSLVFATPTLAENPVCTESGLAPIAATHVMPPYPPLSEQLGEQGTTELKVAIGPDGVPTDVSVFKSSGSLRLDDAAASYVKQSWRWKVAASCKSGILLVAVAWKLHTLPQELPPIILVSVKALLPEAAARNEQGNATVSVTIDKNGGINVGIVSGTGFYDLDAFSLALASARKWTPAQMDGKPVKSVAFVLVEWTLSGQPPDGASPPK